jgi:DNA primase
VLVKPAGKDPDEFIRMDPAGWQALVDNAVPLLDYVFDAAARRHDMSTPAGRSEVARILIPWLTLTADRIVQANYLQRLARMVQVDEATLRLELRPQARAQASRPSSEAQPSAPARVNAPRDKREEFCLALLFRYPELRDEGLAVEPSLFGHSENRALFEAWTGWADRGEPFEATVTPDLQPQFVRISTLELPLYDDDALIRAFRSTVWGIEEQRLRLAKRAVGANVSDVRGAGADEIVERARALIEERAQGAWPAASVEQGSDDGDPAQAIVDDMEAGLKVHQRVLERRRAGTLPHDEVAQ